MNSIVVKANEQNENLFQIKFEKDAYLEAETATHDMELFLLEGDKTSGKGVIEWVVCYGDEDEDVEHIGVWWEDGKLYDYDGVLSFPYEAYYLLALAKIEANNFV